MERTTERGRGQEAEKMQERPTQGGKKELCAGNNDPPIQRPRTAGANITDLN